MDVYLTYRSVRVFLRMREFSPINGNYTFHMMEQFSGMINGKF